jgi:hypothetical protein
MSDDLDVGLYDDLISVGETLDVDEAQAVAIYDEVRDDLLTDLIGQADIYSRPPGYAARPRSGPVNDDGTTEAR